MRDIAYCDSDYCHKKQAPMTASFSEGFYFLLKTLGGSVLHAIKGKPVSLDVSKLKFENETFYFHMIIWK